MPEFRCKICEKVLEPSDNYICVSEDEIICLSHAKVRGRRLLYRHGDELKVFEMPPNTVKSVARLWRDPLWMAPMEPCSGYRIT